MSDEKNTLDNWDLTAQQLETSVQDTIRTCDTVIARHHVRRAIASLYMDRLRNLTTTTYHCPTMMSTTDEAFFIHRLQFLGYHVRVVNPTTYEISIPVSSFNFTETPYD